MWIIGIILVLFAITKTTSIRQIKTSQELKESVEKLERQIKKELHSKIIAIPDKEFEEYSYEDVTSVLTPVTEVDKMLKYLTKADHNAFLKKIKATTTRENLGGLPFDDKFFGVARNSEKSEVKRKKRKKHGRSNRISPIAKEAEETFYRRFDYDGYKKFKDMEVPWIHCEDLIWPFAAGMKKNYSERKFKTMDSYVVERFFTLMKTDTTNFTNEEISSLMTQINNLELKFFKWDATAIKRLLNSLMPGRGIAQTFSNLKKAIKNLIDRWRIDISNTDNLKKSTKIFRPPCIIGNRDNPSTKYSKRSTLTPPVPRTTKSCSSTTAQPSPTPSKSGHRLKRKKKKLQL